MRSTSAAVVVASPPAAAWVHTSFAALGKAVAEAVRTRYPADRATGYAVGDLRGVFWAELPR